MKKTASRIQRITIEKEISIGVRSTKRTHKSDYPVVMGKPFTYKKKTYKFIKHSN